MCLGKVVWGEPKGGCNRTVFYGNSVLIREKGVPIDKNDRDGSHNRYLDFKTDIIRGVSGGLALFPVIATRVRGRPSKKEIEKERTRGRRGLTGKAGTGAVSAPLSPRSSGQVSTRRPE